MQETLPVAVNFFLFLVSNVKVTQITGYGIGDIDISNSPTMKSYIWSIRGSRYHKVIIIKKSKLMRTLVLRGITLDLKCYSAF